MDLHIFIGLIAFIITCIVLIYKTGNTSNLMSKLLDEIKEDKDKEDKDKAERSSSRKNEWDKKRTEYTIGHLMNELKRTEYTIDHLRNELKRVDNLYYNQDAIISEMRNRVLFLEKLLIEQEKNKTNTGDNMNKKDLFTDLNTFLKKHNVYLQTDGDGDEITIVDEDTNKRIQSFRYVIDTVDLDFRLCNMEKEDEENTDN